MVSLPIYSRPNKMHLIKLRFPACCKRIGLFRVQPACFTEIVLRNSHPYKALTALVIIAQINMNGRKLLYTIHKKLNIFCALGKMSS